MRKKPSDARALEALRNLARYKTHGGYAWAAVMHDGELMCVPCIRANYRQVFAATYAPTRFTADWCVSSITNSGDVEPEDAAQCCHCNCDIWGNE
jgi:hypothetical protein